MPMESEQTCPVRSISIHELMAVTLGFWQITAVLLVKATSHISEIHDASLSYAIVLQWKMSC